MHRRRRGHRIGAGWLRRWDRRAHRHAHGGYGAEEHAAAVGLAVTAACMTTGGLAVLMEALAAAEAGKAAGTEGAVRCALVGSFCARPADGLERAGWRRRCCQSWRPGARAKRPAGERTRGRSRALLEVGEQVDVLASQLGVLARELAQLQLHQADPLLIEGSSRQTSPRPHGARWPDREAQGRRRPSSVVCAHAFSDPSSDAVRGRSSVDAASSMPRVRHASSGSSRRSSAGCSRRAGGLALGLSVTTAAAAPVRRGPRPRPRRPTLLGLAFACALMAGGVGKAPVRIVARAVASVWGHSTWRRRARSSLRSMRPCARVGGAVPLARARRRVRRSSERRMRNQQRDSGRCRATRGWQYRGGGGGGWRGGSEAGDAPVGADIGEGGRLRRCGPLVGASDAAATRSWRACIEGSVEAECRRRRRRRGSVGGYASEQVRRRACTLAAAAHRRRRARRHRACALAVQLGRRGCPAPSAAPSGLGGLSGSGGWQYQQRVDERLLAAPSEHSHSNAPAAPAAPDAMRTPTRREHATGRRGRRLQRGVRLGARGAVCE